MEEKVVVNHNVPKYLPKMENPIYQKAVQAKAELREEKLFRIKLGTFNELYPLINNIDLTPDELLKVFASWQLEKKPELFYLYELALKNKDLEQIRKSDLLLKQIRAEEALKNKKRG